MKRYRLMNMIFLLLIVIGVAGSIANGLLRQPTRPMPPGFHLACDDRGRYVAVRDSNDQFIEPYMSFMFFPSTWRQYSKFNAVERAWGQYEHERERDKEPIPEYTLPPPATARGFHECPTD